MRFEKCLLNSLLLIFACTFSASAFGANVNFQGRSYAVTVVKLADDVPLSGASDLIFIQTLTGEKYLTLPSNAAVRADFDPAEGKQRYYVLDRFNNGQVIALSTIDATLIKLDGTKFNTTTESPLFPNNPLETISRPFTIPNTETPVDISIVSDTLLGYRTDGAQAGLQKVYSITRDSSSSVIEQFAVPLQNGDPAGGNSAVFLEFDETTNNHLLVQIALDPNLNTDTRDRISAFARDGTLVSELILDNNTVAFPNYQGTAAGITVDPFTGIIYLLDSAGRQIFVITPRLPAIASVVPNTGEAAGGTAVKINGVNLPADAQVFFDGVPATGVSVAASGASISAVTPPHMIGSVDVTVTGTGIPAATPLKLTAAFTYLNSAPSATLLASPTQGLPPLDVLFTTTATDPDGTIVARVIDFGDGNKFTFPADLNVFSVEHTYTAEGTYSARLTVTDNLGGQKKADQVIIVGEGADLVLRSLSFKSDLSADPNVVSKDMIKLKGEIILPDNIDFAFGKLTAGFVNPNDGSLVECNENGVFVVIPRGSVPAGQTRTVNGGEYCAEMNGSSAVSSSIVKFTIKPLKKKGAAPNTFTVTFQGMKAALGAALNGAVVNLKYHDDETELTNEELAEMRQGKVEMIIRLETNTGEALQYRKTAVVQIKAGKSTKIQLTRK